MHPVINEIGVKTQNEVVKEKRMRYDNRPYGKFLAEVMGGCSRSTRTNGPWHRQYGPPGFCQTGRVHCLRQKYYTPTNAVLVMAGDIDIAKTKQLVEAYFAEVPAGQKPSVSRSGKTPSHLRIIDTTYDNNIQLPAIITAYRTPA